MALMEGFRVQSDRALHDVTLGRLSNQQAGAPLTPFTVVIGKSGVGKSTLFDAFGFVADCKEFRAHATGKKNAPQIFVATHQPYFADALSADEVWILEKSADACSAVRRASDLEIVRNLVDGGLPLGGLWYGDDLDARESCLSRCWSRTVRATDCWTFCCRKFGGRKVKITLGG